MKDRVDQGFCCCGCGQQTSLAKVTNTQRGWVKGEPVRYIRGHSSASTYHRLSKVDEDRRTATCSKCGPTGIYRTTETRSGWRCSTARGVVTPGKKKHLLSEINPETKTATCQECGPVSLAKTGQSGLGWKCATKKSQDAEASRARIRADPERQAKQVKYRSEHYAKTRGVAQRTSWLKQYGLTSESYQALLEQQGGGCAICTMSCSTGKRLCVDHDHLTGRVRGLLCSTCNRALGLFKDDPAILTAALRYITS